MDITVFRSEKNGFLNYRTSDGNSFPLNILQDNIFKLPKDFIITNDKVDDYRIVYVPTTDGTATYRLASAPIQNINRIGGGVSRTTVINLIQQFGNGGTIGGSGTLNFVAKFTPDGTTIGDSLLFDNGTTVQLGGTGAIPSAQFAMTSTTQGILTPRMTTAQRNAIVAPATGLLVYNSSISLFSYWDGAAWQNIDSTAGGDVSGSGTTNFITKWTDGPNSVIGDSLIQDNGTNVGISTAPIAGTRFSVQSAGITSATFIADFYNSTPTAMVRFRSDGYISAGVASGNMTIGLSSGFVTATTSNTFLGVSVAPTLTIGIQNVGIGHTALGALTTGSNNIGIGYQALLANTTGAGNIAIGSMALSTITAASDNNIAIGQFALQFNTTAGSNIAIGQFALGTNTTADHNTAVGHQALRNNTGAAAIDNTALGYLALTANTSGTRNVAIGANAFINNTTGTSNVVIGTASGNSLVGTQNVIIGDAAKFSATTGDENVVVGRASFQSSTSGNTNTSIGTLSGFTSVSGSGNVFIGYSSGRYETASDAFYVNNRDQVNLTNEKALSLIYGTFAATTAAQFVRFNANIGILTNTFGTSADGVLGIKNGTAPTTSPADMIQIFSVDVNTGVAPLASLGLRTEQAVEAIGLSVADSKLRVLINGTEYFILLDTA